MSRIFFSLWALVLFAGCDQKWHGTIIKKRLYLKGFYVHVPSKRATPIAAYPKPIPYPTVTVPKTVAGTPTQTPGTGSAVPQKTPTAGSSVPVPRPTGNSTVTQNPAPVPTGGSAVPNPNTGSGNPGPGASTVKQDVPVKQSTDTIKTPVVITKPVIDTVAGTPVDTSRVAQNTETKHSFSFPETSLGAQAHLGLINGPQENGKLVKANSFAAGFGVRAIMKIKKQDAIVADLGYRFNQFYIGDKGKRSFPLTAEAHEHERISIHDFYLAFSGRILLNKKNEKARVKWLDAGLYGTNSFRTSHVYKDVDENSLLADKKRTTVKYTGLTYLKSFNYGLNFRMGNDFMSVFALWRFSEIVRSSETNQHLQLPPLTFGLEFFVMAE